MNLLTSLGITTVTAAFIAGVAALWIFSAAVGALPPPTAQSSASYSWAFKFLKTIAGDLGSVFGKYLPPAATGALVAVLCLALSFVPVLAITGCSATAVAQDIVNWTPALEGAIATVNSTAALLAPADAPIFTAATQAFDAGGTLLTNQAKAYLANPGASTLQQLQTQVVTFQQQVNSALLNAVKIVDPASQKHALSAIQAVATIVNAMLALVESISSKVQVKAMAAAAAVKVAAIEPYIDIDQAAIQVADHNGSSRWPDDREIARQQVIDGMAQLQQTGF